MEMEKKHFSHNHPLLKLECMAEVCAGCRSDINGLAFGCKRCRFYLHELCAKLPLISSDESIFQQMLQIFRSGPKDEYYCAKCGHRIFKQGFVYVGHIFDHENGQVKSEMLHVDCALLRPPYHIHSIVYIKERELFSAECAECGAKFRENEYEGSNLYGCQVCGYAFHKECFGLPVYIGNILPGQLGPFLDPVAWDFNELDHYFCDECKEEKVDPTKERFQHFSHRHPLVELERTSELCAVCGSTIDGPSFGCERCPFSLHKHCANLPKELHHPSHLSGLLKLTSSLNDFIFVCDICGCYIDNRSFRYECSGRCSSNECIGLKMHVECAFLGPFLNSSYHKHSLLVLTGYSLFPFNKAEILDFSKKKKHPLVVLKEKVHANCVACRTEFEFEYGVTDLYLCQQCGDKFHKECLDIPSQVKRDRHQHDLTLYLDPIPKDYEEKKYYCDDCNEERDIHAFSYACIECDFICHIRCDLIEIIQEVKDKEEERECEVLMAREEEEQDKIEKKLKSLEEELRTTLSEKSIRQAALRDLQERRDRIREKKGRN